MTKKRIRLLADANPLERFESIFVTQWKDFLSLRKKALKKSEPDDIHDLRTSLRRLRLTLKLFEHFASSKVKKKLHKSLRKLGSMLGRIRNIDEALLFFHAQISFSARHPFYKKLQKIRAREWQQLKKSLRLFDHQFDKLVQNMTAELKTISFTKKSERSMLIFFSKLSRHYFKKMQDLLAISTESKQWKSRHALRIAIRKWRYTLEIFAVVLDRDYDLLLQQLKKYQLALGRLNDVITFGAMCKDIKLSRAELKIVDTTLLKQEKMLLKKFTKLIKRKPLITSTGFITRAMDPSIVPHH